MASKINIAKKQYSTIALPSLKMEPLKFSILLITLNASSTDLALKNMREKEINKKVLTTCTVM